MAVTLVPPPPPGMRRRDGRGVHQHPSSIPTVLVTNDDGVKAPGLATLAAAAARIGHVVVAAPADDRSGAGAAVSPAWLEEGILVSAAEVEGLRVAHAVHGPPALAVMAGVSGGFGGRPRVVASGINRGPNTGLGILHSGTVGAALTAGNLGLPALAISIDSSRPRWLATAATVAAAAIEWLLESPAGLVLNVNVPDLPIEELRGVREAPLAHFGTVEATLHAVEDGDVDAVRVRLGARGGASESGTDADLLAAGYVTVTSVAGVRFAGWTDAVPSISGALLSRTGSRAAGRS